MSTNKLKFKHETDMFGTRIRLQNHNKSYDEQIVNSTLPNTNPFKKSNDSLDGGYMFHSPDMNQNAWEQTFAALNSFDNEFAIDATYDTDSKKVSSVLRVKDVADAATIAWSTVNVWEKWSKEKAAEAEEAEKKGINKITVHKDGRITTTVTVESLEDNN